MGRRQADPDRSGKWSTPLHLEGSEEEIFYVLDGSGVSVQADGANEWAAYAIVPATASSTSPSCTRTRFRPGLTVSTCSPSASATTPRTRCCRARVSRGSVRRGCSREARRPPLEPGDRDRPARRRRARRAPGADRERRGRRAGVAGRGDRRAHGARPRPGGGLLQDGAPTVRGAAGEAAQPAALPQRRGGDLRRPRRRRERSSSGRIFVSAASTRSTRSARGSVVARPAGTGRAHTFRAGERGLTVLAYGTRDPRDVTYYPRSGKVSIRGIGLIGRLEVLDYWDGED